MPPSSIGVFDDDSMHLALLQSVVSQSGRIHLRVCDDAFRGQLSALKWILVNLDSPRRCMPLVLHWLQRRVESDRILCYSPPASRARLESIWSGRALHWIDRCRVVSFLFALASGATDSPPALESIVASAKPRLSPRELEILCLLGKGLGSPEIAECLQCSKNTVLTYVRKLGIKLERPGTAQLRCWAVRFACQSGCKTMAFSADHICSYRAESIRNCPVLGGS